MFLCVNKIILAILIMFQESDIGISGLSLSDERRKAVDFVDPYCYSDITFSTQSPKLINGSLLVFKILPQSFWFLFILSFVLMCLTTRQSNFKHYFVVYFSPLLNQSMDNMFRNVLTIWRQFLNQVLHRISSKHIWKGVIFVLWSVSGYWSLLLYQRYIQRVFHQIWPFLRWPE